MEDCSKSLLLTKDQLPYSNCCRFCGLGGRKDSSLYSNFQFVPIYRKTSENAWETLDHTINRYLPIKVNEQDPYYPKVICSNCYDSFERTLIFFDKITEGQELLNKIINQLNEVKKDAKEDKLAAKLDFSDDNPILNAKRRRGRPRKDPNEPKIVKKPVISLEYLERSRRHTRPPARYAPSEEIKEEVDTPAENENPKEDEFLTFITNTDDSSTDAAKCASNGESQSADKNPAHWADSNQVASMDNNFPILTGLPRNIMDLEKLSVIMDGDEEIDSTVLHLVEIDGSSQKGNETVPPAIFSTIPDEQDTKTSEGKNGDNENEVEIIHVSEDENEGSDRSVQLADLIRNTRRTVRKKRKIKRPRKSKKYRVPQISCPDCDKKFSHPSSLIYHRSAVHDVVKKYVCSTCKKGFSHKQLLTNHLFTHLDEKFFCCDLCPSKFKSRASLYTHRKSIHSSKKEFTCERCGIQFNLKSTLKSHMRLHTGEKPFACEFCHKRFAQGSNLKEHRRTHTGERPYACPTEDCDKSFTTASQLRNHKLTHSGVKPFLCSTCGKAFANNENFKYHMRRHNGDRPLECPICHKHFIEPWALTKHWRLHTGEKPYECRQCKKRFSDPSNYSKHMKLHIENNAGSTDHPDELQIQIQAVYDNADIPTSSETTICEDADNIVTELNEQIISAAGQIITETIETDEMEEDGQAQSLAEILNGDNFTTIEGNSQDGESSVIYVYPGEVPIYTITIADNEQTIEVRADDEAALQQALGTLTGGPITFTAVDPGDMSSDYFDLETVDGTTTVRVPASQLSNLSRTVITTTGRDSTDAVVLDTD